MSLIRETGVDAEWLLTGKGDLYGGGKKQITKEEAIQVLFGDRADEVVLFLVDAIKDPFLRAIMYTRVIEYKDRHKNLYDKRYSVECMVKMKDKLSNPTISLDIDVVNTDEETK